jgi:hypothetical protein
MGHGTAMRVSWNDLRMAFDFANFSPLGVHQAILCRQSGKIYLHSEDSDELDELPDDVDDEEKYLQIPDKRELNLGKALALEFISEILPNDLDRVEQMFGRKGAYARFKDLLIRKNALDRWYEFQAEAEEAALRAWCESNSIEIGD